MNKMKCYPLLALLMMSLPILAQQRTIVQGCCKDENGKAVENVSVYVRDSLLVSITDEKGRFAYYHAKAGESLKFGFTVP